MAIIVLPFFFFCKRLSRLQFVLDFLMTVVTIVTIMTIMTVCTII